MTPYKLCPTDTLTDAMKDAAAGALKGGIDFTNRTVAKVAAIEIYKVCVSAAPNIEYVLASELKKLSYSLRTRAGNRGSSDEAYFILQDCADRIEALIAKHKGE